MDSGKASTLGKEFLNFFARHVNSSVCIVSFFLQIVPAFLVTSERMSRFILWFLKNSITLIVNFNQFSQTQLNKVCEVQQPYYLEREDNFVENQNLSPRDLHTFACKGAGVKIRILATVEVSPAQSLFLFKGRVPKVSFCLSLISTSEQ